MNVLSIFLVTACALFFLWMGTMSLRFPGQLLRAFDLEAKTAIARNEIRAVYGGFGMAMTALLIGGLLWRDFLCGIALTIGISMAGMGIGRMYSAAIDRQFGRRPLLFTFVEFALAAALLIVVWHEKN